MSKSDGFRSSSVHDDSFYTRKSEPDAGDAAKYHLQLKQELELKPERRLIPATNSELLIFLVIFFRVSTFRDGLSTNNSFDLYMWVWVVLTIGKVLPTTYAHIVFGKFSPQNHYCLPKLMPILHGSKFIIPIVSTVILQKMIAQQVFYLDTMEKLFFHRSPWNRCQENVSMIANVAVQCYEVSHYLNILHDGEKKKITTFEHYYLLTSDTRNETFTLPHFLYAYNLFKDGSIYRKQIVLVCVFTLLLIGVTKNQIFNKFIWKILLQVHTCHVVVNLLTWTHLVYNLLYIEDTNENITSETITGGTSSLDEEIIKYRQDFKFNIVRHARQWIYLFSSLTCPPLVHFLTARSNNRIVPNSASTIVATFSAVNVFSRMRYAHQINTYLLKTLYIDAEHQIVYGSGCNFISIQIYHSSFYFGELLYLVYFTSKFLDLLLSLLIGIHLLFESITCEWKWVNWWWLFAAWCTLTMALHFSSTNTEHIVAKAYQLIVWAALKDVLEMFAVIFLYPFTRFTDDFLFTFGFASTLFRKITYVLGFFCYSAALILTMYHFEKEMAPYYFFAVIMIFGAIYIALKTVCVDKKSWQLLFIPSPDWGPFDTKLRSQRKQFIGSDSQAPRDLSRTMIKRRNQQMYNLDMDYVGGSPASTISYTYEKKIK